MKKSFRLENLCCANCAAKMEDQIGRLAGVAGASVNIFTQKLTLDAEDARYDAILDQAARICSKIEPDCALVR